MCCGGHSSYGQAHGPTCDTHLWVTNTHASHRDHKPYEEKHQLCTNSATIPQHTLFSPHIQAVPSGFSRCSPEPQVGLLRGAPPSCTNHVTLVLKAFRSFICINIYIYIRHREIKCRSGRTKYWCRA